MASWASLEPQYSSPPVFLPPLCSYVDIGTCVKVGESIFRLVGNDLHGNVVGNLLQPLALCDTISAPPATTGAGKTFEEVVQTMETKTITFESTIEIVLVQTTDQLEEFIIGDASIFVRHIRYRDDGSKIRDWYNFPCAHSKYQSVDCSIVRNIYEGLSCLADSIGHILNKRQLRECDRGTTLMNPACWNFLKRYFATTKLETLKSFTTKRKRLQEGFVQQLYSCRRNAEYLRLSTCSELERLAGLLGPTAICGIRRQPQKEGWIMGEEGLVNIISSTLERRNDYNQNGDWVRRTQCPGVDIFSDGHIARLYVRFRLVTINKGDEWPCDYLKKCATFSLRKSEARISPPMLFPGSQYEDDEGRLYKVIAYDPLQMVATVSTHDKIDREVTCLDELDDILERVKRYLE